MQRSMKRKIVLLGLFLSAIFYAGYHVYQYFHTPIATIDFPLHNGSHIIYKFYPGDISKIIVNSNVLGKESLNFNDTTKVEQFVAQLNKIIANNTDAYVYYYDQVQRIYPERFFILCIDDSCGYYWFTVSGLLNATKEDLPDKPLIVYIDENAASKLIKDLKENPGEVPYEFKEMILDGKIRVYNFDAVAGKIIEIYQLNESVR